MVRNQYLLMHGELGNGENIGRFIASQGRCTPILSKTRKAAIVDYNTPDIL